MVKNRVANIRQWLSNSGYNAVIVPTNDPHFSEYVAEYWKSREWISGFTGSAGTVVITANEALLWCDSRYFVQSSMELDSELFSVMKIGIDGTPSINEWLNNSLEKGDKVAIDGKLFGVKAYSEMVAQMPNISLVPVSDPFISLWDNRPEIPKTIVRLLNDNDAGESVENKCKRVIAALNLDDNSIYVTMLLDEIAWLLNIRGADVQFNPVVISYAVITNNKTYLFTHKSKFIECDYLELTGKNIEILDYSDFESYISSLENTNVIINSSKFDIYHYNLLQTAGINIIEERGYCGVITSMKAIKNTIELKGINRSMVSDGVSLVKFNMWLERALHENVEVTEFDITRKLHEFRMSCPTFIGDSFNAIVGYKSNGAIVHYSPTAEDSRKITANGFLLMDSGGQYEYGTTDITRTLHLSNPTDKEKTDYTLVLKGNISLAMAVFPSGTCGFQLDILARQHLLRNGLNYMHGTGHGIGHYLNVHEGPQSIRMDYNPVAIVPGMVTSNEPGLYRVREYGIRLENIIECVKHSDSEYGELYKFQTITLYPFDSKCINIGMLTTEERHWLNRYHAKVFDKLSQFLETEERFWLSNKTKAI